MASYDLIQKLMDTGKSGAVTFTLPKPDGKGYQTPITGCLIGDISIKLSNKFQAVLPNIDALTLASQIITNDQNALAWTASTQSAWMGSEPLRLSIPFYLFSFNESDLRFLDPKGHIVGLYAKGKAKKDTSGFVKYPTIELKLAA